MIYKESKMDNQVPKKSRLPLFLGAGALLVIICCCGAYLISKVPSSGTTETPTAAQPSSASVIQPGTGQPNIIDTPIPTLVSLMPTFTSSPTNTTIPTPTPTPTETPLPQTATAAARSTVKSATTTAQSADKTTTAAVQATANTIYHSHFTETSVAIAATQTARSISITATREAFSATATEIASYKEIYWKELVTYPDKHIGEKVIVRGEIFHVISDSEFQMYVSGTYNAAWVTMMDSYTGIYEDTSAVVYGVIYGTQCGTNAFGAKICQPAIIGMFFGQ
jgi:hypothetical protein